MKYTSIYEAPVANFYVVPAINIYCSSPTPGGNEDIGYEDWNRTPL